MSITSRAALRLTSWDGAAAGGEGILVVRLTRWRGFGRVEDAVFVFACLAAKVQMQPSTRGGDHPAMHVERWSVLGVRMPFEIHDDNFAFEKRRVL